MMLIVPDNFAETAGPLPDGAPAQAFVCGRALRAALACAFGAGRVICCTDGRLGVALSNLFSQTEPPQEAVIVARDDAADIRNGLEIAEWLLPPVTARVRWCMWPADAPAQLANRVAHAGVVDADWLARAWQRFDQRTGGTRKGAAA